MTKDLSSTEADDSKKATDSSELVRPVVYGLILSEDEAAPLIQTVMPTGVGIVTSLFPCSAHLAVEVAEKNWERLEADGAVLPQLVRAQGEVWPKTALAAAEVMAAKPQGLKAWHLRNLLWVSATRSLVYTLDSLSASSLDLTMHLTAARVIGATSIGIVPSELRENLPSAQIAMTTACVGEADTDALRLLLTNLA